jgi:SAM-dependent methyltransferase
VRLTSAPLPQTPNLINHPLDQPLPFSDESFDAIYSFHVIEHLSPRVGERFAGDVHRLLKPGGICRFSTPDLEFHASEYLSCLRNQLASPSTDNYADYQWALFNVIDQAVREVSGGEMLEVIRRGEYRPEYVKRVNGDLLQFISPEAPAPPAPASPTASARLKLGLTNPTLVLRKIASLVRRGFRRPSFARPYLEVAHERNLWFFDRLSLRRLLANVGFKNIEMRDYCTSAIPDWNRYNFDQSPFGDYPLEPSLYMEATKAESSI